VSPSPPTGRQNWRVLRWRISIRLIHERQLLLTGALSASASCGIATVKLHNEFWSVAWNMVGVDSSEAGDSVRPSGFEMGRPGEPDPVGSPQMPQAGAGPFSRKKPMRGLLHLAILVLLCSFGARGSLGQVQTTPTPLPSTPLISGNNITCSNTCDISAMSCQNSCFTTSLAPPQPLVGGLPAPSPSTSPACLLNCTSQHLVCKQGCNRAP
jgi:hypothetical protein